MKRRIAMISDHASPLADPGSVDSGGQNVYVAQVSRRLAAKGYTVDVFTRRDNPLQPEIYTWDTGLRVIHVPAGPAEFVPKEELIDYMPAFSAYMIDFISQQSRRYDLVHANFWMSALLAMEIKAALDIPFVVTFHALGKVRRLFQGDEDSFPDLRFDIEDRAVMEAERIIAECPQDQEDLLELYQAAPEKLLVIPCGFDSTEMWPMDKALARLVLGIPAEEKVVLQLGRMVPRKGVDFAIRGFGRMVKEHGIDARMIIVGGDAESPDMRYTPEIGRLKKIATEEGVRSKVHFTGKRPRHTLKYYYSAADVFISTPWYEPFGITPVEAMACGTPVIGTNVGGIKYTIEDGKTGFLVERDDVDALAEKLAFLYTHPHEFHLMSKDAMDRANELFTWETVTSAIVQAYEEVLASRPAPVSEGTDEKTAGQITLVSGSFDSAVQVLQLSQQALSLSIVEAGNALAECIRRGGKVMVCGNGGSAAESQHFAAELVGRFVQEGRRGMPVMALTADTTFLTAWANDIGYDQVFSRQVESFGQPEDILIGISTSGMSPNMVEAFKLARQMGIHCLALLGGDGGSLLTLADHAIVVPSTLGQRIQEVQLLVLHLLAEIIERELSIIWQQSPIQEVTDLFIPGGSDLVTGDK